MQASKKPPQPRDPGHEAVPEILVDHEAVQVTFNADHQLMKITVCASRSQFGEQEPKPVVVARLALTVGAYNSLQRMLHDLASKVAKTPGANPVIDVMQ